MNRLILILILLFSHSMLHADVGKLAGQDITTEIKIAGVPAGKIANQTITSGGVAACNLLEDTFEGADGTNITSHGSWVTVGIDPGDLIEINTAISCTGSSSVLIAGGTQDRVSEDVHAEITSGKYTMNFQVHIQSGTDETGAIGTVDGTTFLVLFRVNYAGGTTDQRLQYYNGSWTDFTTPAILTPATCYEIEIEIDLDTDTFSAWLDNNQIQTSAGLWNTGLNPDRTYLKNYGANTNPIWYDNLCVTSGAR